MVQWLRLCAYNAGSPGLSPGLGTRSCMLQLKILCAAGKTEDPTCHQDLAQPNCGDPMDCSLPGSSVRGIFQAKVLEWVAISFSRGSSWPRAASIANRRFTAWATREAQINIKKKKKKKKQKTLEQYPGNPFFSVELLIVFEFFSLDVCSIGHLIMKPCLGFPLILWITKFPCGFQAQI